LIYLRRKTDAPFSIEYYALTGRRRGKKRSDFTSLTMNAKVINTTMLKENCKINVKNEN